MNFDLSQFTPTTLAAMAIDLKGSDFPTVQQTAMLAAIMRELRALVGDGVAEAMVGPVAV